MLTERHQREFDQQGFTVVQGLFSPEEVASYREHYMNLRKHGHYEGDFSGVDTTSSDPLKRYPRMIHMHRWDDISLQWMIDKRINACLSGLLRREPFCCSDHAVF